MHVFSKPLKYMTLTMALVGLHTSMMPAMQQKQPIPREVILHERQQTRVIDAMAFTLIAAAINEYFKGNVGEKHILLKCTLLGIAAWGAGELIEGVAKKIYQKITGHYPDIRKYLGESKLFGVTIDHQRLVRRCISLIILIIEWYYLEPLLCEKLNPDL